MKRHNQTLLAVICLTAAFTVTGCATTEKVQPEAPVVEDSVVVSNPEVEPEVTSIPEAVEKTVSEPQDNVDMAEYERSKGAIDISVEEFTNDKKDILNIISNLERIMADKDYESWAKYVDSGSKTFWSNITNLRKASNRLPSRGSVTLKSLSDYFIYVFIPSRQGRNIDEIRYMSSDSVEAVQVLEDKNELVYYNFKKVNGEWKLSLPRI